VDLQFLEEKITPLRLCTSYVVVTGSFRAKICVATSSKRLIIKRQFQYYRLSETLRVDSKEITLDKLKNLVIYSSGLTERWAPI
jgi:hypothetical protein